MKNYVQEQSTTIEIVVHEGLDLSSPYYKMAEDFIPQGENYNSWCMSTNEMDKDSNGSMKMQYWKVHYLLLGANIFKGRISLKECCSYVNVEFA